MTRARLLGRVADLERRAAVTRDGDGGVLLEGLTREELAEAAALCLIEQGADPATAAEAFENRWRLGARGHRAGTWADLVPLLPEALALRVADLRRRAELGGASPEDAARLEDAGFRRRVCAQADRLWPPEGWTYCQGFAWVVARVAGGAPEGEVTHDAYYGPVRGPEMALAAARRLARDGTCGPGPGSP